MSNMLIDIKANLDRELVPVQSLLPAHVSFDRFTNAAAVALAANNDLFNADRQSVINALTACAKDGLIPDNREAAMVVYKKKQAGGDWKLIAQYMPMIDGVLKHARQSGDFDAEVIAEEFRQQIDSVEVAEDAKAIGSRIDAVKNELGANLYTELKNKALGRFHQLNADKKIKDLINGLPKAGSEEASAAFADVEKKLEFLRPRLGDVLYQAYCINLRDMKPEYIG
ncbi:recombinase RecT [Salmonella enterica]|nr:hypothetical protein [Salmonella enterica]ECD9326073.1 recombinase RecT [Salmonella enterica subsp. houtenae]EAW4386935.1 recombinase RecT [Salmonella enterica]EAX9736562.1 recombinase RecT [Salmonella enterica]EBA6029626.1 recombinase RecT [Salmonella enterica]